MIFIDVGASPLDTDEQLKELLRTAYHGTELNDLRCDDCESPNHNMLNCQAECHPSAGLVLWYYRNILIITCSQCESQVGRFAIANRKKNNTFDLSENEFENHD